MKIIFDSEEQKNIFLANAFCPSYVFTGAPDILDSRCKRGLNNDTDEVCAECWKKYIEFEVKDNEQKS